jgi:hypothetical protein
VVAAGVIEDHPAYIGQNPPPGWWIVVTTPLMIPIWVSPNSAIMGLNITLIAKRAPALKKIMTKEAATMYQP